MMTGIWKSKETDRMYLFVDWHNYWVPTAYRFGKIGPKFVGPERKDLYTYLHPCIGGLL